MTFIAGTDNERQCLSGYEMGNLALILTIGKLLVFMICFMNIQKV